MKRALELSVEEGVALQRALRGSRPHQTDRYCLALALNRATRAGRELGFLLDAMRVDGDCPSAHRDRLAAILSGADDEVQS